MRTITEERDNLKNQLQKTTEKFEESHTSQLKYQEDYLLSKEKNKLLDDKLKYLENKVNATKLTFKDKKNQINDFKKDVILLEIYKKERVTLENKLNLLSMKNNSLNEENE